MALFIRTRLTLSVCLITHTCSPLPRVLEHLSMMEVLMTAPLHGLMLPWQWWHGVGARLCVRGCWWEHGCKCLFYVNSEVKKHGQWPFIQMDTSSFLRAFTQEVFHEIWAPRPDRLRLGASAWLPARFHRCWSVECEGADEVTGVYQTLSSTVASRRALASRWDSELRPQCSTQTRHFILMSLMKECHQ